MPQPFAGGAIQHFDDAQLAHCDQRLAGFALEGQVNEDALVRVVEIPGVVGQVLVVPLQFARIGIQRQRRIGVQRIVFHAVFLGRQARHFGDPRVGLADADNVGVGFDIVAACVPGRRTVTFLNRHVVPGIAAGRAGLGDGIETPDFRAGFRVVPGHEATAGLRIAATAHALHDLAARHQRSAGVAPALGPVRGGVVPGDLAGFHVERDEMRIGGGDDQVVAKERHIAFGKHVAAIGHKLGGQVALVFPQQVAIGRVERLYFVGVVEDEQHAVMHDRRDFGRAGGHRPGPCDLQAINVVLVDGVQRAVTRAIVGAPEHQPIRRRRIAQHLIGHGCYR